MSEETPSLPSIEVFGFAFVIPTNASGMRRIILGRSGKRYLFLYSNERRAFVHPFDSIEDFRNATEDIFVRNRNYRPDPLAPITVDFVTKEEAIRKAEKQAQADAEQAEREAKAQAEIEAAKKEQAERRTGTAENPKELPPEPVTDAPAPVKDKQPGKAPRRAADAPVAKKKKPRRAAESASPAPAKPE